MKKVPPTPSVSNLFVPARAPSHRQLRVAEEVRHILSVALARGDLPDPGVLTGQSITVTHVQVSPDLQYADVSIMPLGGKNKEELLEALKGFAGYFRHHLAKGLRLKVAPRIRFHLDQSLEYAERIETLLRSDDVKDDDSGEPDA